MKNRKIKSLVQESVFSRLTGMHSYCHNPKHCLIAVPDIRTSIFVSLKLVISNMPAHNVSRHII